MLGSASFDIDSGPNTTVTITLSKAPINYLVCFSSFTTRSGSYDGESRSVSIGTCTLSGTTMTVEVVFPSYWDHDAYGSGTVAVYGN